MIRISGLRKTFKTGPDSVVAIEGVDLHVNEKEFFVLLGPSVSGKTTLLRCVAGLEKQRPERSFWDKGLSVRPGKLYHFPLSRGVGEFLGSMNELEGTVESMAKRLQAAKNLWPST